MAGSRTGALMNYPCLFCPSDNFEHHFNRSKKIENEKAKRTPSSVAGSSGVRTGALMNYPFLFCPSDNFEHRFNRSKKIENKMAQCTSSVAGSRTALTVRRQARCFRLSPTTRHWLQHNHQNQSKKENVEGRVSIHKYSNECFLFSRKYLQTFIFAFHQIACKNIPTNQESS